MTELSKYTSLRVGGPAQKIVQVSTEAEIIAAIEEAGDSPVLIIGGGTNLLISDKGFAGTVIRISNNSVQSEIDACSGHLLCEDGMLGTFCQSDPQGRLFVVGRHVGRPICRPILLQAVRSRLTCNCTTVATMRPMSNIRFIVIREALTNFSTKPR